MSSTPNRRHEDGGSGSGSAGHTHPSGLKYSHDEQGPYPGNSGKVVTPIRHDYHLPYDMGQDSRMPKIASRNESRDADRKAISLQPHPMFRVPVPPALNEPHADHVSSDTRMEFRDSRDSSKDMKVDNRELKSDPRELQHSAKTDRYDSSRADDAKDAKHERDSYSEHKGEMKLDKDVYTGSNSQFGWKDLKEQHRPKQHADGTAVNVEAWHMSRTSLQGTAEGAKEGLQTDSRDPTEARGATKENKVDLKGDDKFREKERKRKEMKHRDWAERDKERSDRRNNLQLGGGGGENKEVQREERESEKWVFEKKDPLKDKEKPVEKEKVHIKRESWNASDKDISHTEKEPLDVPGKSVEQEIITAEPKKKDQDTWKNAEREARDRKKERDADVESERPEKRGKFNDKEAEECGMESEGGNEREREVFNSGVQQRKRMLRPRGSPQTGSRDLRIRPHSNDNEGQQGHADASCIVYKIGESMQELIKLWKEYESSKADKASESSQNGPTLEIRIPAEHVTATNRQVRGGQLWGTDVYTVDSDLVAVLMHTGYCRPTASPPPPSAQELRATIRVLPPQEGYISTLRNNVRSRAWGAAIGCSYCVEHCCIVKKGGGIIELEPCLTHSSTMEPTLAPVAAERTMTTRAAASNALRQQRFVREVTVQFNLCMEPWLKYSISAVADKGLKRSLFTSARLKKGEVLYVETRSCRYELCFAGEKVVRPASAPHVVGAESGRIQAHNSHHGNGEKSSIDGENAVMDLFRWSRCKRALPQKTMLNFGIPLPPERVEVVADDLEWEDISWSQTGVQIAGKVYHLARVHFLSAQ